jgi:hypothetical protein
MRIVVVLLVLVLGGCVFAAQSGRDKWAAETSAKAITDCQAKIRTGELRSYQAAAECARPRIMGAYQEAAFPFEDLVAIKIQAVQYGAESIDSGEVPLGEVQRQLAVLDQRIEADADRRRDANYFYDAPPPAAPAQLLFGLNAIDGSTHKDCLKIGSYMRCR